MPRIRLPKDDGIEERSTQQVLGMSQVSCLPGDKTTLSSHDGYAHLSELV